MEIGDLVIWQGRACYLRGVQPMGIPDRTADLEDAATGDRLVAPFAELRRAEPGSVGAVEPPAA